MTHIRPEVIRITTPTPIKTFSTSLGKEILRPGMIGAIEIISSFTRPMNSVLILNDGPNPVYVDFDTTVTIVTGMMIPAKSWWSGDVPITSLHFICAAAQTATIYITGFRLE